MQKGIRFNDGQLLYLAGKAKQENTICGFLYKKSSDLGKWQQRWFVLYQNLLMYFESDTASRPSGVALLEGSYCDRAITPAVIKGREAEKQGPSESVGEPACSLRLDISFRVVSSSALDSDVIDRPDTNRVISTNQ